MDAHAQMHKKKKTMPTTSIFENQSQRLCKGLGLFEQQSLKKQKKKQKHNMSTIQLHLPGPAAC